MKNQVQQTENQFSFDTLKSFFDTFSILLKGDDFYITGSAALSAMGFQNKVNDIDVVIRNPNLETLVALKELQEKFPAEKEHSSNNVFIINHPDYGIIDFFTFNGNPQTETFIYRGIPFARFHSILQAKRSYNRPKDWIQLYQLANSIVNTRDFLSIMGGISVNSKY